MKNRVVPFIALAAIVFLLVPSASAGDFASLNFIGFSKNGKYLAFEEFGTQDGSGYPYSNIYFIDVVKNSFVTTPVRVTLESESATENQARARSKTAAAAKLRRFGIVSGNRGTLVVARLLTDLNVNWFRNGDSGKTQSIAFADSVGSMYTGPSFDLVLNPQKVVLDECDIAGEPNYKFELVLKNHQTEKTAVLQRDAELPSSRYCPLGYAIQYVHLYENYIAVILNYYRVGFEGPDMRYLIVTGKYK